MMTRHAKARAQQRAIPPIILNWLLSYGCVSRHNGADVYYFDKKSRKRIRSDIGSLPYRRMEDLLNAYAVVSNNGSIVTVGKRYKRLRN